MHTRIWLDMDSEVPWSSHTSSRIVPTNAAEACTHMGFHQDPILAMYSLMFIAMITGISQKTEDVKWEFHENVTVVSAKARRCLLTCLLLSRV
jgi:hypothetical protein